MEKINEKIGQNPLRFLLFLLILALACAYVSWKWQKFNEETVGSQGQGEPSQPVMTVGSTDDEPDVQEEGDAVVSEEEEKEGSQPSRDFFAEARFRRERTRAEKRDVLLNLIENKGTDEEVRKRAQEKLLQLADRIEQEREMEGLITSKGFEDAVVYLREDAAMVIIKAEELSEDQVAKVVSLFQQFTDIPLQNLTIMSRRR